MHEHKHPHQLTSHQLRELARSEAASRLSPEARRRLDWMIAYVCDGRSIVDVCREAGVSRNTFHRWMNRFDPTDLRSLEERTRDDDRAVSSDAAALIEEYRRKDPMMGKQKISSLLFEKHHLSISPSSVGRIIERDCLYFGHTPLHQRKRMHYGGSSDRAEVRHETFVPVPAESAQTTSQHDAHHASHSCGWCVIRLKFWPVFKRALLITSVAVNVLLIASMIMTAVWEGSSERTEASVVLIETKTDLGSSTSSSR